MSYFPAAGAQSKCDFAYVTKAANIRCCSTFGNGLDINIDLILIIVK